MCGIYFGISGVNVILTSRDRRGNVNNRIVITQSSPSQLSAASSDRRPQTTAPKSTFFVRNVKRCLPNFRNEDQSFRKAAQTGNQSPYANDSIPHAPKHRKVPQSLILQWTA